jgi:YjbR
VLSATTTTPRAEIWAPQTVNILRIQDTRVSGVKRATAVEYCLALPGAYLDSPWGEDHNVVKVGGKIFAFLGGEDGFSITLKNTEDVVDQWRQEYPGSHWKGAVPLENAVERDPDDRSRGAGRRGDP